MGGDPNRTTVQARLGPISSDADLIEQIDDRHDEGGVLRSHVEGVPARNATSRPTTQLSSSTTIDPESPGRANGQSSPTTK